MDKEAYLIVISILEGRNFPVRPKHQLVIECRFDGELLSTDPVQHNEAPNFTTELAWEMNRKSLHQHRMQRTPVKLQCFAVDMGKNIRENVGYVLLDLRGAQLKPQPAKWYNILSSKYSRLKPAVKIAIMLEDDSVPEKPVFKAQEAPPRLVPNLPKSVVEVELNEEDGYFQIGPIKPNCEMFVLAVTLGSAYNLEQLIRGDKPLPALTSGFFFYYSLFGSDITNDPFFDLLTPDITPERASIRLHCTYESLEAYFAKHADFKVHLCCGDQLLGTTSVSLGNLFGKKQRGRLTAEAVSCEGIYCLQPSEGSLALEAVQPRVAIAVSLRKESVAVDTVVDNTIDEKPTVNLEAAPNDQPVRDTDDDQALPHKIPIPHSTQNLQKETEKKIVETDDEASSIASHVVSDVHGETSVQPVVKNSSPVKSKDKPVSSDVSNSLATTETHTDAPQPIHHFRFSLDIKTLSHLHLPHACNLFVKYSYPFFGSFAPIITGVSEITNQTETALPRSLCLFDFACPPPLLASTFRALPVKLELWHRDTLTSDLQLGVATLVLSKIIALEKDKVPFHQNGRKFTGYRQTYRASLPVSSSSNVKVAQIDIVTCLEDLGEVRDQKVIPPSHLSQQESHRAEVNTISQSEDPRQTKEYKTAIELELWKSQEKETFSKRMKELEQQHLLTLGEEFKKRDREREALVSKQISQYQALEKKLANSIAGLEKRENQVKAAEQEIGRLTNDCGREKERVLMEAKEATRRMKEDCIHQVQLERERKALLEEQNKKLLKQVNDLEQKYAKLMSQFYEYKNEQSARPEVRLQAELNLLKLEKTEMERKLESATKSKLHYKQQWGRTLKELAAMKKREQDHALANLRQQQQELENLKIRYLASGEKKAIQDDNERLRQIQSDIQQLKENPGSAKLSSIVIEPCQEKSVMFEDVNERVSRLIEERDTLLRTGVYSDTDRIITELDRQIKEEMSKNKVCARQA